MHEKNHLKVDAATVSDHSTPDSEHDETLKVIYSKLLGLIL